MIYPVKVFYPDGKLKKIISSKVITNRTWRSLKCTTASFKEPTLKEIKLKEIEGKKDKIKCIFCPKYFKARYLTSKVCKSARCKQKHYRKFGAVPKEAKICPICSAHFYATPSRKFCNNPCKFRSKSKRKK